MNEQFVYSTNMLAVLEDYLEGMEIKSERLKKTLESVQLLKEGFFKLDADQRESISNFILNVDSEKVEEILSGLMESMVKIVQDGLNTAGVKI